MKKGVTEESDHGSGKGDRDYGRIQDPWIDAGSSRPGPAVPRLKRPRLDAMYGWREHTGELALVLDADTEQDVFDQALAAFAELMTSEGETVPAHFVTRRVSVSANDRGGLLAEWINALVFLVETEGFVPCRAVSLELKGPRLTAQVEGWHGQPPNLVKAATYHDLCFECRGGAWHAVVVLDV